MSEASKHAEALILTDEDRQNMRVFLKQIFVKNPSVVDQWEMNEKVFEIVQDMINEGGACEDAMQWVPRPQDLIGGRGGVRYIKKVLKAVAKRVIEDRVKDALTGSKEINHMCRSMIAYNYSTALQLAGLGL